MEDLDHLARIAERLALGAAELLLDGLGRATLEVGTKSTATDLVTDVDRASERFLVEGILAVRPDDGILGEEGTDIAGTTGVRWVIDPLDGTTNYVYGHAGFSVSVAAVVDGVPSVGVVVDPVQDDLFSARLGGGAHRNQAPIRCSDLDELGTALVATGFGYVPDTRAAQAQVLTEVLPSIRDVRRMGGAAVDLCSTACARVDAYYERGLAPWDMAAGVVIAREAGARVGDLRGGEPSGEFVLAAPPALFEPLAELLLRAGADQPFPAPVEASPRAGAR
ncbi:inositol monophosphatase family protein [Actinomarinicola tropica]|uniref:inositol monophosphatase family protein n=1 Tax=Actinomarinicola tropica TaxID=2789776 RepID=UPI001E4AE30A|nr:inositol monophosphatase family protein [Actinomarinicola tropica]